ncbi:MAG: ribosome-binding factor A [Patescibacteria group bacterium]
MNDRHDRVANLIKELSAQFIQHEANTDPLITVTKATTSPDYRKVTIFVTTIPDDREEDAIIFLKRSATELRRFLKQKSNLKIIPHLEFSIDYGERHRQHTDEVFREIDDEKKTDS